MTDADVIDALQAQVRELKSQMGDLMVSVETLLKVVAVFEERLIDGERYVPVQFRDPAVG